MIPESGSSSEKAKRLKLGRSLKLHVRGWLGPLPRPERWVFIVGCYNSGTTLLHSLIALHPDVGSLPTEGQFLTDELPVPRADGLARRWALNADRYHMGEHDGLSINVKRIKKQWGACFNHVSRSILIEKSPTNAARTRWLQANFENAHFIGIVRNGYTVADGIARRTGCRLTEAATQWARSNEYMLRSWPSLAHRYLVRYEALANRPQVVLKQLFEFLELDAARYDWESLDEPKQVHERFEPVANLDPLSLSTLDDADRTQIESEALGMLQRLGYADRAHHSTPR